MTHSQRRIGLIVEDLPAMQLRLRGVLEAAYGEIAIEIAPSVRAAREKLEEFAADGNAALLQVVLVDIGLPDGSGIDILKQVYRIAPDALRIVATVFDDDDHLMRAFAAGAQGYLLKDEPKDRLVTRLRNVGKGEPAISPSLAHKILGYFTRQAQASAGNPQNAHLTRRETDTLQLIGRGLRVSEAAMAMGVSEHTVSTHLKAIYAKLGISSRAEAALEASRRKLV